MNRAILGFGFGLLLSSPLLAAFDQTSERPRTAAIAALQTYQCSCLISTFNLQNSSSASPSQVTRQLAIPAQPTVASCQSACASASTPYRLAQSEATAACSAGAANGTILRSYSRLSNPNAPTGQPGMNVFVIADYIGRLVRAPGSVQHQMQCPAGWMSNTGTQQPGGVTTDGKCKKVGGILTVTPLPPDGTQLGTWGFSWGNRIYVYGSAANGGAAVNVTTTIAPVCRLDP